MKTLPQLHDWRPEPEKFSQAAKIFRWPVAIKNEDLLAPRRQVRKFNFFAAFAPLREIFRVLVAASPHYALRRE
ncbi:MAG TPA: hypothetical protein VLE20_12705 [Blastocatellia bacterium]|nr:hypothetical protein [Blastocatellia bacterium]